MEPEQIHNGAMPVTLSVKNVPEKLAARLRERAARNHRSLQGELMAIVEQAVKQETEAPTSPVDPANPGAPRIVGYDPRGRPIVTDFATSY